MNFQEQQNEHYVHVQPKDIQKKMDRKTENPKKNSFKHFTQADDRPSLFITPP